MAVVMSGNYINVRPGGFAFNVSSNLCDWFELGVKDGKDYWLEADIVGEGEFLFNGRLFLPDQEGAGTIIDNFPRNDNVKGWTRKQLVGNDGYALVNDEGQTLFGYKVEQKICRVTVNIYAADGSQIAESLDNQLKLFAGPAKIGRGGIFIT